jgi:hypothetical protein
LENQESLPKTQQHYHSHQPSQQQNNIDITNKNITTTLLNKKDTLKIFEGNNGNNNEKNVKIDNEKNTEIDNEKNVKIDNENNTKIDNEKNVKIDNEKNVKMDNEKNNKKNDDINISSEYFDIFSCDNYFLNGEYRLTMQKKCKKLILKSLELYNNLYNITNFNNKIEIQQNNLKTIINIPPACYSLNELLNTLESLLNERIKNSKFKITYIQTKNRINIISDNTFSFRFIENDKRNCILLRYLLGFSQIEYINNNNYNSDQHSVINIYDNIYIKIINPELVHMNKYISNTFTYYEKLSFDYINTFNKTIKFHFNTENILNNLYNLDNLTLEIYHRHVLHDQFYKIHSKLIFNILFEIIH